MNKKTTFIGHRNILDKNIGNKLYEEVKKQIDKGCKFFTMGTHGDFDKMALSVLRQLRKEYKDIEIEVVITSFKLIEPKISHDAIFGNEKYIPYSDVKTVMYDIEEEHFKRKITVSNRQMIDTCNTLICYVNPKKTPSGAKSAMNYAKRKGLKIINLFNEEH